MSNACCAMDTVGEHIYAAEPADPRPADQPVLVGGSLRQAFMGQHADTPLVLQILKTDENNELDTIEARVSDSVESADKILFYHNIKKNVKPTERYNQEGAIERKKPFISVLEYDILFKKYFVISKFKYLNEAKQISRTPEQIDEQFFATLERNLTKKPTMAKLKACLRRNVPTSGRKRLPEPVFTNEPAAKRPRARRVLIDNISYIS